MARPSNPRPSPEQRFWSYVKKTKTCWLWTGQRNTHGYGYFKIGTKRVMASRFAWELFHKRKLGKYKARHACDNPPCVRVNWRHVIRGTQKQNMADALRRGRWHPRGADSGARHPMARLTSLDVAIIRAAPKVRGVQRRLALRFGVTEAQVSLIRLNLSWQVAA